MSTPMLHRVIALRSGVRVRPEIGDNIVDQHDQLLNPVSLTSCLALKGESSSHEFPAGPKAQASR